jgi:hypothetical protein
MSYNAEFLLSDEKMDFNSGSSDLYQPSEDERDTNSKTVQVKKKATVSSEQKCKKNMSKCRRIKGKSYLSVSKKLVPPRTTGQDCKCKYKYFMKVDDNLNQRLLSDFNKLGDKRAQDVYLAGLVTIKTVKREQKQAQRNSGLSQIFITFGVAMKIYVNASKLSFHFMESPANASSL